MNESHNPIDEQLLIRYIKNELTEEERTVVEEWLDASEENQKLLKDYFHISWAASSLLLTHKKAPEKALQQVNKRIHKSRSHTFFRIFQRVAALLFIPLLLLSGYLLLRPTEELPEYYLETRMTPGMIGSLELPDGTKVWLNSSSYLKYPISFNGDIRQVELDGEAYFQVQEDKEKAFIVKTPRSSIRVLGTAFNIDAYSENKVVTTTLVEGAVEFSFTDMNNREQVIFMQPNQQIIYEKETGNARHNATYVPKDIAWKDGQIILKDTPLSEVLWILSKRFNVEFSIRNPSLYSYSFTGIFTNQQIERVLEHFKRSSYIKYKIDHQLDNDGEIVRTLIELF